MDIEILVWFGEHRNGFLNTIFSNLTFLGNDTAAIVLVCALYWCFSRRTSNRVMFSMLIGLSLNQVLKIIFATERPWIRDPRVKPYEGAKDGATGYSFPSGHTANIADGLVSLTSGKHTGFIWKIASYLFIAVVAFSRMYLGVHTPQDVLCSLILCVPIVIFSNKLTDAFEKKPSLDIWVPVAAVIFCAGAIVLTLLRHYPSEETMEINTTDIFKLSGAIIGAMFGWFMERRTLNFPRPEKLWQYAGRFILGIAILLAVLEGAKPVLTSLFGESLQVKRWGGVARYGIAMMCAMYLWPLAFTRIEKALSKRAGAAK